MPNVSRTKTWVADEVLTAADLNAEYDGVLTGINNNALDQDNLSPTASYTFANVTVSNGGTVLVGATAAVATSAAGELQVLGTAAADSTVVIGQWAAAATGPKLSLVKSRNATIGSSTIVADNDVLGTIEFMADDGVDFATPGATIFARVNGTPGANDMPTELVLATTADAGNTVTERLRLNAAGDTSISGSLEVDDSESVRFGTGQDASISYDGTNLNIQPQDVGSGAVIVNDPAILFINETTNADMTIGLTLNQAANDDEIIAFKSSDAGHGMTDFAETDTFGDIKKASGLAGGMQIRAFGDGGNGLNLLANITSATTTDTTASSAALYTVSSLKSGTGVTDLGATGNIFAFTNNQTTRVLMKGDGTVHASDTTWATGLDDMPDFLAGRAYVTDMAYRHGEGLLGGMEVHRPDLVQRMEEAGVVTRAERPGEGRVPGHRFLNVQKSIKFSWDMGFQLGTWLHEIVKVLNPQQRDQLPLPMRKAFQELEDVA